MNITECVILGGGKSVVEGLNLGLQARLKDKFVIGVNYAFKTFDCTFTAFQDRDWYHPRPDDQGNIPNPDLYEELKKLSLIIGINHNGVEEFKLDNTILLSPKEKEPLSGIFALKLALKLMKNGNLYLLGYDWNRRTGMPERDPNYNRYGDKNLHFYDDIQHRGTKLYGYYENHNPDKDFNKLIKKDILKIYNVSLESNINCFDKLSYQKFFELLSPETINQTELRNYIRTIL